MNKNGFNVLLSNGKLALVRFSKCSTFIRTNERVKEVDAINCNITSGGDTFSGAAACSPDDEWNIERGISLALCRAIASTNGFHNPIHGAKFEIKDTKDFLFAQPPAA